MLTEDHKSRLGQMLNGSVLYNEPLSNHSTIKIGGPAAAFISPAGADDFVALLKFAREEEIGTFILGAGSNVLIRDGGLDGIVIATARLNKFNIADQNDSGIRIKAEAGVFINDLVNFATRESAEGFEYLAGIPGTVGGALSMNAGTHDGQISDKLISVNAVDKNGREYEWAKDKIEFSYRKARYPKACVIVSAEFFLPRGDGEEIKKRGDALREKRRERHPLSWPSLGSVFKNPPKGPSAGELIDEAGLKGVRVGGARIAMEHGNWIVNENNATAKDVEVLVQLVREKVKEMAGISLETEIVIIGEK